MDELLCGAVGGAVAALTTHPLDTIKTRVQAGLSPGALQCVSHMLRHEGVGGLFRGISIPIVSQPLYIGSAFAGAAIGREMWDRLGARRDVPGGAVARAVFSGMFGGVCCAVAVTPFERLKVLMQAQSGPSRGLSSTIASLYRQRGPAALFVGLQATLVREIPGTLVWLGAFDLASGSAHGRGFDRDTSVLVGAVAAAVAFWTMALPVDTIKTMQQASSTGSSSARLLARRVWQTHGLGGFYAGVVPVFTRGLLLDIMQFSAADQVRRRLPSRSSADAHK